MPRHTVSLSFRYELVLGEPSIHLCFSRLQFGLRESNSHIQVQSLASCHWTKPDCRRSGETRTLTSRSKNPVRCQLRHRPDRSHDAIDLRLYRGCMAGSAWEWMESNHLVQDDHRVTAGYLTVRSHSQEPRSQVVRALKRSKPAEVLPRRAPGAVGYRLDLSRAYESGAPVAWGIICLCVLSSWLAWLAWLVSMRRACLMDMMGMTGAR
jgi:hypothetical protein